VEDILVHAVSGCKFCCSVVVIYNANCSINNYVILTTVNSHYHH